MSAPRWLSSGGPSDIFVCHPERVRQRRTSRRICGCFSSAKMRLTTRWLVPLVPAGVAKRGGGIAAGVAWSLVPCLLLAGCKPVGPNYNRPGYNAPPAYKEAGASAVVVPPPNPQGGAWQPANPSDSMLKGKWWEIYQDPQLNQLEERIDSTNVQLRQAMELYLAAEDQVRAARANLYPAMSAGPSISRNRVSANRPLAA